MKLRLHISRSYNLRDYAQRRHIRFTVIDVDQSNEYPANYVCMLPLDPTPNPNGTARNIFSRRFGNASLKLAKRLLTQALRTETDAEVKVEIDRRLELLAPKPAVQVKCRVCGTFFEPRWRRSRQKLCQECTQKKYASQT